VPMFVAPLELETGLEAGDSDRVTGIPSEGEPPLVHRCWGVRTQNSVL
jgi:hypothetical protein